MNLTRNHEVAVQSLAALSGLRILCCCVLWCRLAAIASISPLAWEPPYDTSVALKRQKTKHKNKTKQNLSGEAQYQIRFGKKKKKKKKKNLSGVEEKKVENIKSERHQCMDFLAS